MGDARFEARGWSGALRLYRAALRRAPAHAHASDWHFRCGYCLHELNRNAEAITAYTQCIELDSKYAEAFFNRGNCHYALKSYEQALADYNQSIRLDPSDAAAYSNRCNVWEHWLHWSLAIEDLNKALSLTSDAAAITAWRERLRRLQGRAGSAQAAAEKKRSRATAAGSAASADNGGRPSK